MQLLDLPSDILRNCIFKSPCLDNSTLAVCRFVCRKIKQYIKTSNFKIELSAKYGYFGVLKWARSNGCSWNDHVCTFAARQGHLEILKWLGANDCPWNSSTCSFAASGGYLEILKWLRENGCPWNEFTCSSAAVKGHIKILQWCRENGCPRLPGP